MEKTKSKINQFWSYVGTWIRPEDFDRWDWLKEEDHLVILNENQGCCRAGIRRKDLTKADPPVYVTAGDMDDRKWT